MAPTVTAPQGTIPLGCNPASIPDDAAVWALVRASDNCGLLSTNVTHLDGGTACASNRTFTIIVTDACQNKATNTLVYTWRVDVNRPALTGLPAASTNYQCFSQVPAAPTVTANDNCDGAIQVSYTQTQSNPGSSCNNIIKRTWSAADTCGNSTNFIQTITVNDTTPPTITCPTNCTVVGSAPPPDPSSVTVNDTCG